MSRLNATDLELLQTGQNIDLSSAQYAYLGGEFTKNPNDYVEILIYDTNENFLESAIVDSGDYIYDVEEGIKLKTGTILRKLGYDRGRYVIKYNFLRKAAGSYENVLVNANNERYTGDFDPSNEIDRDRIGKDLFIKEYKYFIHEISPTRKEIRLIPQQIKDSKYINDFFSLQRNKKIISSQLLQLGTAKFSGLDDEKPTSYEIELPIQTLPEMINGIISLEASFIKELEVVTQSVSQEDEEAEFEALLEEQQDSDYGGS